MHVKGVKKDAAVARGKDLLDQVGLAGQGRAPIRHNCPVVSSSGWRSPGRWP